MTFTTPVCDRASNAQKVWQNAIKPEGRLPCCFAASAPAMQVCGKQGDFDTLRHSSGTLKGEILL
jgi:hypothetical protein